MPADLDNSEMREHTVRMKAAHRGVGAAGSRTVRAFTLRVEARGKVYCPVDTGHLVSTIGSEFAGDGRYGEMSGTVSATAKYAGYVHDGTSRQAPQPFLSTALAEEAPGFEAACALIGRQHAIGGR